jgi:Lytic transglycolase
VSRPALVGLLLLAALAILWPPVRLARSAPVIPASSGAMLRQDQARSGTPNRTTGESLSGVARVVTAVLSGVPSPGGSARPVFLTEGRVPVRLSVTHAETATDLPTRLRSLRTLTSQRTPVVATGSGARTLPWQRALATSYGIGDGYLWRHMACGGRLTPTARVVAHRTLPCGTRVTFRFRGHTVTATVADRGPYVAGRTWDFGPAVARALHFDGLDWVTWRRVT